MKTQEQIINEAKEAYTSHFEDSKELSDDGYRGHDVILDQDKLLSEVDSLKVNEEMRHESLEVLRTKLTVEAEEALQKTFGEEHSSEPIKKMNSQEMYDELNKEKQHLTQLASALKQEQLDKMKH